MASNKRLSDLTSYAAVLPYASELFGIYQPLLGWRSKRMKSRFASGLAADKAALLAAMRNVIPAAVAVSYPGDRQVSIDSLKPGTPLHAARKAIDSVVMREISARLPPTPVAGLPWSDHLSDQSLTALFREVLVPHYTTAYLDNAKTGFRGAAGGATAATGAERSTFNQAFERQLQYESAVAGGLQYLLKAGNTAALHDLFYHVDDTTAISARMSKALAANTAAFAYLDIDHLDPQEKADLDRVALSPISVVHLFRQYFFELDSFLGTPTGHVWMSPGSVVELIEVSTRRTLVEKSLETALETTMNSEQSSTEQDEISDAVKDDNKQDMKFGASVSASYASVTATSSFDLANSQQQAREQTHKRMRQQTQKLSSEIRRNFKTTFKTVTETTDSSSKRYTLKNDTGSLINYELRRKMRQVGVQVQDIGSYLCWQTYVDNPGRDLGIAKLIHIAKPPELDGIPHPEEIPKLQPFSEQKSLTIPFMSINDSDADNEEIYVQGHEVDDSDEQIQADFLQEFVCPKANFELVNVELEAAGAPVQVSMKGALTNANGKASFTVHLDYADFQGKNSIGAKATLYWSPAAGANADIDAKNAANTSSFKAKEKLEFERSFIANAKERVTLASKIHARSSDDLREEERIVVYRRLIQDLLTNGVPMPDDRTRHVVAELINSIFDVDKMLYFVAPEWWRPRLHPSHQQLAGIKPSSPKFQVVSTALQTVIEGAIAHHAQSAHADSGSIPRLNSSTVTWGGAGEAGRDSYYITEDSDAARFGSSLGWLLQLDGDNLRNAFLNAPWVKAVIPIRPGKEQAAINWLKGVEGFDGIGDKDIYHASNPGELDSTGKPLDGQKLINVLIDLAKKVEKKHREGMESGQYPKAGDVADPSLVDADSVVTSTPIDRVYEHGFYPLKDSFRANVTGNYEIFDQWVEVLPTDQIAPVEVKYDPKTGRQV